MGAEQNIHECYMEEGASRSHATATINDKSKAFIIAVLVALNLLATVMMFIKWRDTEREVRMQEYYLLELDAKFIAASVKKPEESLASKLRKEN
jgi:uncharacterized membrane protein YidH (DUF202 family)